MSPLGEQIPVWGACETITIAHGVGLPMTARFASIRNATGRTVYPFMARSRRHTIWTAPRAPVPSTSTPAGLTEAARPPPGGSWVGVIHRAAAGRHPPTLLTQVRTASSRVWEDESYS